MIFSFTRKTLYTLAPLIVLAFEDKTVSEGSNFPSWLRKICKAGVLICVKSNFPAYSQSVKFASSASNEVPSFTWLHFWQFSFAARSQTSSQWS